MQSADVIANIAWGVGWGIVMAAAYSAIALAIYAVLGHHAIHTPGLTIGKVLMAYWIGGLGAGFAAGVARPLFRYRWALGSIGALGGLIVSAAFQLAYKGPPSSWSLGGCVFGSLLFAVMGCRLALDEWDRG